MNKTSKAIRQLKQSTPYEPKTAIASEMYIPNHSGDHGRKDVQALNGIRYADRFASIQAAINDLGGAGIVYIPAGTYTLNAPLQIGHGVQLCGAGVGATTLTINSADYAIKSTDDSIRYYRWLLKDFTLRNTGAGGGISLKNLSLSYLSNIEIDCSGVGLLLDGSVGCYYNDVYSMKFRNCSTAILMQNVANENKIYAARIDQCTTGINIDSGNNCFLSAPSIENATTGIILDDADDSTIISARLENCTTSISITANADGSTIIGSRYSNSPTPSDSGTNTVLLEDGTLSLANLDVEGSTTSLNFVSDAAIGTQPYACTSTTVNTNLNADLWDGYQFADYLNQAVKTTSSPSFAGLTITTLAATASGMTMDGATNPYTTLGNSEFYNIDRTWDRSLTATYGNTDKLMSISGTWEHDVSGNSVVDYTAGMIGFDVAISNTGSITKGTSGDALYPSITGFKIATSRDNSINWLYGVAEVTGLEISCGGTVDVGIGDGVDANNVYGIKIGMTGSAGGMTNLKGIYTTGMTTDGTAYNIYNETAAHNFLGQTDSKQYVGSSLDASFHYDGTDLVFNTAEQGSGTFKFNSANNWTANGTNTVTISNVAPSGVGTATISKWFTVKDNNGTVYYIPAWT